MLQAVAQKFLYGCMMLFKKDGDAAAFLGTCFLVHREGYLLTAAHAVDRRANLMVVPNFSGEDFLPMSWEPSAPIPASIVSYDDDRDVALLKLGVEMDIGVPDHILGNPGAILPGTSLMCIGYAYGYQRVYNPVVQNAILSAKIVSLNDTRMLLFDSMIHHGDIGAPLINATDQRIVGVVNGQFDPAAVLKGKGEKWSGVEVETNISYAVSIDYGAALMEAAGLEIS